MAAILHSIALAPFDQSADSNVFAECCAIQPLNDCACVQKCVQQHWQNDRILGECGDIGRYGES